ncbi:MAG: endonuclease/exonuclease/phosphatase family protein [Pirellulaceae bacterium]
MNGVAIRFILLTGAMLMTRVMVAAEGTSPDTEPCDARVMTFNIRYNNPHDGENAWPNRRELVARLIQTHADIAGLQEALKDQIDDLEARLPEFAWSGVGREDGENRGEFCPIFYRRERFELVEKKTWWLSETPDVAGSKSWDAAITRIVTVVRLRDRKGGGELQVVNTHFDHLGSEAREASARLIRQSVALMDVHTPVVVMGDFNSAPNQEPYRTLTKWDPDDRAGVLIDSRSLSQRPPEGPNSTWNAFLKVVPGRRIDFIFVRPPVEVVQHRTLSELIDGRFPSDHLPVVAYLVFPTWRADQPDGK